MCELEIEIKMKCKCFKEIYVPDTYEDELEDEYMRINIQPLRECHVHLPNGDVFPFTSAWFVIAAGSESGHIANLCGLGIGKFLSVYYNLCLCLIIFYHSRS